MFCQPTFAKAVRVRFPVRQSSCPLSRAGGVDWSGLLSLALAISGWVACGFGEAVEERAWDCCHVLGLRGR